MANLLDNGKYFKWVEQVKLNESSELTRDGAILESQAPWVTFLHAAAREARSYAELFLVRVPTLIGMNSIVQATLIQIGQLMELFNLIETVLIGYSGDDVAHTKPRLALVFNKNMDLFVVTEGPTTAPSYLPPALQGIIATTGGWSNVYLPPLSNFSWFLMPDRMTIVDVSQRGFFPSYLEGNIRRNEADPDAPPYELWPQAEECLALGELANSDVLVLVTPGFSIGNVYMISHEAAGPLNHLAQKDHISWLRWVFGTAILCIKGQDYSRPWYY